MADRTKIEWTDASWNPIRARNRGSGGVGHYCARVSDGCRNCYAERMQPRFGNPIRYAAQDIDKVELFLDEAELLKPLRWKRPRMVFVCSMTDLFLDAVPDSWLDRIFAVMAMAGRHSFQALTKRAAGMRAYCREPATPHRIARRILDLIIERKARAVLPWPVKSLGDDPGHPDDVTLHAWPLPNVWLGVSVEDQAAADERIPILLDTPAALRWISAEPLLGPIDLTRVDDGAAHRDVPREEWGPVDDDDSPPALWWDVLTGERTIMHGGATGDWSRTDARLDWVVAGGESGPGARPMHPDWARFLRDQCAAAGVPFLFKQWGEWLPEGQPTGTTIGRIDIRRRRWCTADDGDDRYTQTAAAVHPIGKARAGRLLDGVLHDAFPAATDGDSHG